MYISVVLVELIFQCIFSYHFSAVRVNVIVEVKQMIETVNQVWNTEILIDGIETISASDHQVDR